MAERIDELQLFIGSDASDAIRQLGNLAAALDGASRSASRLQIATGQLRSLSDNLSTLSGLNLDSTINGLERLSNLNFSNFRDTGITTFTNSLRRLVNTNTSNFDVGAINGVTNAIRELANVGAIDNSLRSVVSSIAQIANSGTHSQQAVDGLRNLSPVLTDMVRTFSNMDAVDSTVTDFVASVSNLARAGESTGETAQNLDALSDAVMRFINALSGAPQIDANIATTIQALGNLAQAGARAGRAMNSVLGGGGGGGNGGGIYARTVVNTGINATVGAMRRLYAESVRLGGQGAAALRNFFGRLRLIPTHNAGINSTALSFGNLLKAVLPFVGLGGLFNWGKEALEAGTSIVELENVIDTAFGNLKKGYEDISGYIYDWAQGTIDTFGVSQLAAERYAGRLMSMFNSSGFDVTEGMRDSAAKMSTELIQRAGDIASFYDITVDEAMTKIQSGLAGMTRPLRSLGINMSVANMQAFALSQGITESWQSMDQASQMMLRYQYLMNASQYAAGDFQRTSQSLANQLRLLQLNFQQLSATMGQGFISAVAPVVSWLNLLIKRLIQAAVAFRTFMWTLFGKPIQAARGANDDLAGYLEDADDAAGGLADGADGASSGLGKAGKAAKELKKQLTLLPFDELNQLAKDTSSASSGGSGGGGGGVGGLGGLGNLELFDALNFNINGDDAVDKINKWAQRIRKAFIQQDWQGLGKNIAYFLNYGFGELWKVLDWSNVGPKVYGFIEPFQATINSLMYYIDWGLIGRTFGRGLNTITYTLRTWINGFNWKQWGGLIADGLNSMLDEWDADAFGRLISDKFRAAWNFFGGFVKRFNFKNFGKKLKDMINGAITELNWSDMGNTLAEFFNGVNDAILEFFNDGTVVDNIASAFSSFVNSFLKKFDSEKAKEAMRTVKTAIATALGDAIRGVNKDDLQKAFTDLLEGLPWSAIGVAIGATVGARLATGIFGLAFRAAALRAIMGVGTNATINAGAAGVGGGAAAGVSGGAFAGLGGTLGAIATSLGALVAVMKIGEGASELYARSKGVTTTASDLAKDRKTFTDDTDADLNYDVKTPQKNTYSPDYSNVSQLVTIEGVVAPSAKEAMAEKLALQKNAKGTVTVDGKRTKDYTSTEKSFNKGWENIKATKQVSARAANIYDSLRASFTGWRDQIVTKTATAKSNNAYNGIKSDWLKWASETIKKTANAGTTNAYNTVKQDYMNVFISNVAKKTATGEGSNSYWNLSGDYQKLTDKRINVNVTQTHGWFEDLGAYFANQWHELIDFQWHAKGGLFNGPMAFHVFGEAGAEAAIPLERKSTMKRIASAIVDSGGMEGGSNSALAKDIALAVAPYIMEAIDGANNRPVNVNATLYTENDEVLARAVTRGQRSIDKRYNPVSQFSY